MAKLIALLSCMEPHEGPWLRPCGRETGVRVYPELGDGEEVFVDVEGDPTYGSISFTVLGGFTSLPLASAVRYRVRKLGRGTPTSVEIVSNGKAPAQVGSDRSEWSDGGKA